MSGACKKTEKSEIKVMRKPKRKQKAKCQKQNIDLHL